MQMMATRLAAQRNATNSTGGSTTAAASVASTTTTAVNQAKVVHQNINNNNGIVVAGPQTIPTTTTVVLNGTGTGPGTVNGNLLILEEQHSPVTTLEAAQVIPIALQQPPLQQQQQHHVIPQKKLILQALTAGPDGGVSVIDVLPLKHSNSNSCSPITVQMVTNDAEDVEEEQLQQQQQQVTAQVAVVQTQSPNSSGPHYITVTAVSSQDNVGGHHGAYHVQYVDSDTLYTTNGQQQAQMSYPVYAVGDYTTGGQYYTTASPTGGAAAGGGGGGGSAATAGTGGAGNTSNGGSPGSIVVQNGTTSGGGVGDSYNGNGTVVVAATTTTTTTTTSQQQQQYLVNESLLHAGDSNGGVPDALTAASQHSSRDTPPSAMGCEMSAYIHSSGGGGGGQQSQSDGELTPNLSHATRVSPATVAWLMENYETAEGVSLPRSTLYNHYMRHCNEHKLDAVNAASFGKLIRSVFTGLRTRRLGTRGNSKYHYYGIRVKPSSSLIGANLDETSSSSTNAGSGGSNANNNNGCGKGSSGGSGGCNSTGLNQQQQQQQQLSSGQQALTLGGGSGVGNTPAIAASATAGGGGGTGGGRTKRATVKPLESFEQCAQYLGDGSGAIPIFPHIDASQFSFVADDQITLEDVDTLRSIYREHCEAFLDAVLGLEFGTVEQLWREFWRAKDTLDECEEEKYLSKSKLYKLCQLDGVQLFIKQVDLAFYQNMVDVLIPDVLRPIPSTLTQAIRNFAKNLENWLTAAMAECPTAIVQIKLSAVAAFSQTLRRYTSLNHLAQAARAVLQNNSQISQMLSDLNRVDFHNVQEQASWVCQCDMTLVERLENDFKVALQQQNTLEQWASWLRLVVDTALEDHYGKRNFVKAARQFLLKWSFYSSMVIRDLTLRSAASFGSFHLIRLLYDEYMFFIVEHKVAQATQTTPIAVMTDCEVVTTGIESNQPHDDEIHGLIYADSVYEHHDQHHSSSHHQQQHGDGTREAMAKELQQQQQQHQPPLKRMRS